MKKVNMEESGEYLRSIEIEIKELGLKENETRKEYVEENKDKENNLIEGDVKTIGADNRNESTKKEEEPIGNELKSGISMIRSNTYINGFCDDFETYLEDEQEEIRVHLIREWRNKFEVARKAVN